MHDQVLRNGHSFAGGFIGSFDLTYGLSTTLINFAFNDVSP